MLYASYHICRLIHSKLLSLLMAKGHLLFSLTNVELFNKPRVELPLDSLLETTCTRITHCLGCLMWQPLPVLIPLSHRGAMCSSESVMVNNESFHWHNNYYLSLNAHISVFNCSRLIVPVRAVGGLTVSLSNSTITYGTQANYNCRMSGYELVGDTMRVCGADGKWTGKEPMCQCKKICK